MSFIPGDLAKKGLYEKPKAQAREFLTAVYGLEPA